MNVCKDFRPPEGRMLQLVTADPELVPVNFEMLRVGKR
jgi:hypothetical protein